MNKIVKLVMLKPDVHYTHLLHYILSSEVPVFTRWSSVGKFEERFCRKIFYSSILFLIWDCLKILVSEFFLFFGSQLFKIL